MPTIKDVAREAGVSIATVSYVLNGKHYFVSDQTRRQVLETIARIGYIPKVAGRNLQSKQTRLIGYTWHEVPRNQMTNPVMDTFTYYLAQAAENAGYHVLTFTSPSHHPLPAYDEMIRSGRVDAFVLSGTLGDDARIKFLLDHGFPFVSFGRSNPEWDFAWVDTDGQRGMVEAVDYLLQLGHRKIAMAAWDEASISGSFRLSGYKQALRAAGVSIRPDYIVRGEHSEEAGRIALARWLELPPDDQPTGIVAVSDMVAIGIMLEAEQRGIKIGEELSVIGFDDTPIAQYIRPSLTSLQQPVEEIGRALINMLELLLSHDEPLSQHVLVPPRLIVRQSCKAPQQRV